ncbi:MAG: protein kinase, partial [Planctomycetota bacterium]
LGTPTYMAPEQARGKSIDRRIDIWAFGCVLYECLTAKRAFDGETLSDVLSSVLRSEVALEELPAATPPRVRALLGRCLHKDPRKRLRDIGDARLELEDPAGAAEGEPAARPAARWLPWALAASASLVALAALLRGGAPTERSSAEPVRLAVRMPHGASLLVEGNLNEQNLLALSPDGSTVALVVRAGDKELLFVRRLDTLEGVMLAGTEEATSPFFSPDGRWLAFFAGGKLCKVAVTGGEPIELADAGLNRGGVWCPDGTIVYAPSTTSGLFTLASQGGMTRALTELDPARQERSHRWPALLPGGEIAFTVGTKDQPASYDDARIDAVVLATGARRELLRGASMVKASSGGQLVFTRDHQLLALPLAHAVGGSSEGAVQVLQGVAGMPTSGVAYFDLAANGTLVYAQRHPRSEEFVLAWATRTGEMQPLAFPPREYRGPRVSPDGKSVAVGIGVAAQKSDVWIGDLATGALRRLTLDGKSGAPAWTRDGSRIAYCSFDGTRNVLAWQAADGSGEPEILHVFEEDSAPAMPQTFAPDARGLLFLQDRGPGHSGDLLWLDLATRAVQEVKVGESVEFAGSLSPDGRWLGWTSDDSGRVEVYVQAFPGPGSRRQVSERGGYPTWSVDGRELFYLDGRGVFAVPVQLAPSFTLGAPQRLFEGAFRVESETLSNYDVAPDGRFLVVRDTAEESMAGHINVVLHWDAELERATASH